MALKFSLYSSFVILYLVNEFINWSLLTVLTGLLGFVSMVISFPGAKRTFQLMSIVFLIFGVILYFQSNQHPMIIFQSFSSTGLLLSLLYILPFMHNIIIAGRYDKVINQFLHLNSQHVGQLYIRTSFASYILSLFLFVGAIPLVYKLLNKSISNLPVKITHKIASQSILRSFACALVWCPTEVFIALVGSMTGLGYLSMLPWLFIFSLIMVLLDWLMGWRYKSISVKKEKGGAIGDENRERIGRRKALDGILRLIVLLFSLGLLIGLASVLKSLLKINFFAAISVLALPFNLVWASIIKRLNSFVKLCILGWKNHVSSLQNFMLLFISLGFFNGIMGKTNVIEFFQDYFILFADYPLVLFFILQFSSLLLSLIGFHPFAMISLQSLLVQPLLGIINPLSLAVVLITVNVANDAAGPYNTSVVIMNDLTKENPYRMMCWNIMYACLFGWIGIFLAWLLL